MTLFQLSGAQHSAPEAKWNADFSSFCYGSARATPAWGAVMPQPIPANLCCSSRPCSIRWEQPCSPHEAPAPSRSGIRLSSFLRLGSTRHPGGRSCDVCHEGRGRKGSVQVQLHRGASNGRQVDALCQARRCQDPCPLTPRTHQLAIGSLSRPSGASLKCSIWTPSHASIANSEFQQVNAQFIFLWNSSATVSANKYFRQAP